MNITPPIRTPMYMAGQLTREWVIYFLELSRAVTGRLSSQVVASAAENYLPDTEIALVTYTATGACTLTLLAPENYRNKVIQIKDTGGNAAANNITVSAGASTIDGAGTYVMNTDYECLTLFCDGTEFFVV